VPHNGLKNIAAPYYLESSHFVQYEIDPWSHGDPFYYPYFTAKPLEDGTDYLQAEGCDGSLPGGSEGFED
jgi:hypothetical protein